MKDNTIVVTGGGRGIGLSLAYGAAQAGGNIAVIDSLSEPHEDFWEIEKRFGVKAKIYR